MSTEVKSRMGGVIAALILIALVAVAVGIGYEEAARRRDLERFPRVGRAVDIGGRALNIFCSGQGSPAVIFESDAMVPGYSWVHIQREIAGTTQACWYDRAGYGWSDPGPAPHTSTANAADLRELLHRAGLHPPYVLVGDGFGTLNVHVYAGLHPDDVVGMVLVDPIVEDEEQLGIAARIPFHLGYPPGVVLQAVSRVGLMRLLSPRRYAAPRGLTPEEQSTLSGLEGEPKMKAALLAEEGFSRSLAEVRSITPRGDLRQIVLRSERVRAEAPETLVQGVRSMLTELRGK